MNSTLPPEKTIEKLLIVRLSAMGDVIHTLPAVHLLREAFPEAFMGWLIEERWAPLLCSPGSPRRGPRSALRPLVDEVHAISLKAWSKSLLTLSTLQDIAKIRNDVREAHYDAAIDLQGAMRSALLARWSGAREVWGSAEPRESPASLWYTRRIMARGRHVIDQNLSIAQALAGASSKGKPPDVGCDLPRDPYADEKIDRHLADTGIHDFAILNPGAGWGAKRWPAERYGIVARGLADYGLGAVLNYGPGEEDMVRAAEAASDGAARVMNLNITELISLTRRARLFVGGDTGPLHLAAALNVPVVAIYGPTDPARNGPFGTRSIVLRSEGSITSHKRRAHAEEAMLSIGSDEVLSAARKLLQRKGPG